MSGAFYYNDVDSGMKYLMRAKRDPEVAGWFDKEVMRAIKSFVMWIKRGDSVYTASIKTRQSYGQVVAEVAIIKVGQHLK